VQGERKTKTCLSFSEQTYRIILKKELTSLAQQETNKICSKAPYKQLKKHHDKANNLSPYRQAQRMPPGHPRDNGTSTIPPT
jgi:hypothetical protein